MSGFIIGGAGGYRTPVQTKDIITFYMFIFFCFSKLSKLKATKINS